MEGKEQKRWGENGWSGENQAELGSEIQWRKVRGLCRRLLAFHWPLSGFMKSCPSPVHLIYSHECFVCISERVPRICLELEEARSRHWARWTGVRDGRELPRGCWQLNPGPLQQQQPTPQPWSHLSSFFSCGFSLEATGTFVEWNFRF